ncbi:putative baseplate assembly protein [Sphingomonas gei]|uniref:Putative baseplate assembly protein n=1 Tax=Sphingomonas gei TaxID=1395960 RepID=A0A4S1X9F7_9SPHN|nr:putative baseplate assembly protein [Sphingomonas gei]TGX52365.1 putative baseplate assembly protein [Sphingomonas gei]
MSDPGCSCQACVSGAGACGCCEGVEAITPRPVANRPGLTRLSARIGTHADFLETMQARLSTHALADGARPLSALRTRDPADASIALLDAFAVAGDVLTFYQERIAGEGYLRTATQGRSVRELARLIGYEPSPGVSASTYLAFTLDSEPETPVTIAAGTGAKSLPRQNELPQIFETSRDLAARARWNLLGIRTSEPERGQNRDEDDNTKDLYFAGTDTGLKPGDALLFQYGESTPVPMRVLSAVADTAAKHTFVAVEPWERLPVDTAQNAVTITDDDLKALILLRDEAPGGTIAASIVAGINHLQQAASAEREKARLELVDEMTAARARIGGLPQVKLREWLDKVEARLQPASFAANSFDGPVPFDDSGQGCDDELPLRPSWIEKLALPASVPPRSAEKLALSTGTSFAKGSDAAYKTLAVAVPAVGAQLGAALSGTRVLEGDLKVFAFRVRSGLFGRTFPKRTGVSSSEGNTESYEIGEWPIASLINDGQQLFLREDAQTLTLESPQDGILPDSWVMVDMRAIDAPEENCNGDSDGPVTGASTNGNGKSQERWLLAPTRPLLLARAVSVDQKIARADYGGIGDSTAIHLGEADRWFKVNDPYYYYVSNQDIIDRDYQLIRRTTVYARSEQLALAARPLVQDFCVEPDTGAPLPWIELDGTYSGLEPGRYVAVSGERADIDGVSGVLSSEVAMIAEVVHGVRGPEGAPITPGDKDAALGDAVHTFLRFANALSYCYGRGNVTLQANVVKATHGETQRETLGNGDAAGPRQRFALKRFPLTYTPAPNATGLATSLEIFVDDIRWRPEPNLIATGANERAYTVRNDAGGKATVIFPDGRDGVRPPTGMQNIRAVYRAGIGRPGNLGAGRIDQLVVRPLGVKGVINPVAATGGADAEPRERTRKNAPVSTMALDRLVSIRDHADFARSFAGIALASAQVMASAGRRVVHLTVAAEDDAPLDPYGELLENLRGAFRRLGDPDLPVVVSPRELKLLIVSAKVRIDEDRLWEPVAQAIRAKLLDLFGFEARELAQGAAPSVLVAAIQSVPGVAWVDLDVFGGVATMGGNAGARLPRTPDEIAQGAAEAVADGVQRWVPAYPARPDPLSAQALFPAELLLLSPDVPASLVLNQIK